MRNIVKFTALLILILMSQACFGQTGEKIQSQEKADTAIQTIIIKHSGFLKEDELIIRFNKNNYELVEVIDAGEQIPSEEFGKYEIMLDNYLQFRSLDEIVPRVSRL